MGEQLLGGDQAALDEEGGDEEETRRRAWRIRRVMLELVAENLRKRLLLRVRPDLTYFALWVRGRAEHKEPQQLEEESERLQSLLEHIDDQIDHAVGIEIEAT